LVRVLSETVHGVDTAGKDASSLLPTESGRGIAEGLARLEEVADISAGTSEGSHSSPPGRLFAGLYLPSLTPAEGVMAEEIAREAGAHGVSLFEMGSIGK
jgi:hypothetical protein